MDFYEVAFTHNHANHWKISYASQVGEGHRLFPYFEQLTASQLPSIK